jgi:outer membrane protein assembly factor BamB
MPACFTAARSTVPAQRAAWPRLAAWACLVVAAAPGAAASGSGCPCGSAGDDLVAAGVGLVREWIVQIPFDSASSRLQRVVVGEGLVVAQSGDGGVHAVQAARDGALPAGTVLWSRRFGRPGEPVESAGIGGTLVTVAHGLGLEALDRESGRGLWHEDFASLPGAGAVQIGDWVYAPLNSGGVRRLAADPLGQPTAAPPPAPDKGGAARGRRQQAEPVIPERKDPLTIDSGGRVSLPPVSFASGVCWTTDEGRLVALEKTRLGWDRHELELGGPSAGPLRVADGSLVVATNPQRRHGSADLMRIELGKLGTQRLQTAWRVPLPGWPAAAPLVADGVIVVSLGADGLAAFSAASGERLWRCPLVGTLVAAGGGRVWCIDETGRLSGLDLASGWRRVVLGLGCFTVPVVNAASDGIVLASPTGVVVSLAPAAAPPAAAEATRAHSTPEAAAPLQTR